MGAVDDAVQFETLLDRHRRAFESQMAPAGKLKLSELLDERRLQYLIPDKAFEVQPLADRVFVAQMLSDDGADGKFVKGGLIQKPQTVESGDARESPRGIIVAAGLIALDSLRSHGADLGHEITFTNQMPWTLPLGRVGDAEHSIDYRLLQMRAGDISGSADTRRLLLKGELQIDTRKRESDDVIEHVYKDKEGTTWIPIEPFSGGDY